MGVYNNFYRGGCLIKKYNTPVRATSTKPCPPSLKLGTGLPLIFLELGNDVTARPEDLCPVLLDLGNDLIAG